MKRLLFLLTVLVIVLAACASPNNTNTSTSPVLKVSGGAVEKSYSVADLKALGNVQASDKGVAYIGVPVKAVLQNAGVDPSQLSAVKAVASDGFTVNYEPAQFLAGDLLIAYARADGPLSDDEGTFRIVFPDQGGKLNPRMLVEVIAIP